MTDEGLLQVRDVVVDAVTSTIHTLVMPRFDEHDKCLDAIGEGIHEIKKDVRVLKRICGEIKAILDR